MIRKAFSALAILLCFSAMAEAKLSLRHVFSDGMVLQQNSNAAIWGSADPKAEISVCGSWSTSIVKCKADKDGNWKVYLPTPAASYESRSIVVSSGKESITINDVLIGEVWFASGQSNMEMPMRGFFDCPVKDMNRYVSEAPATNKIRMFSALKSQSYEPMDDIEGHWAGAESSTIREMSATAYFFARKLSSSIDIPIGIVLSAYGGARVESWTPKDILETYPDEDLSREHIESMTEYHRPYLMYNAMLNPLKGYTIKGFIWYQGCSNVGKHEQFVDRMSRMVARWRQDWGDTDAQLPFYQVEIAPCTTYSGDAALLRQAQHESAHIIPNSGIVVTNDLVEPYEAWNIHPCDKQSVGDRLAYLALNRQYGFSGISCNSPEATSVVRTDDEGGIGVTLTEVEWNGVNRIQDIVSLEVRGEDGVWHEVADAAYSWETKLLMIKSPAVKHPVEVRYGWGDYRPGNLVSWAGLPVSPFCLKVD